MTTNHRGRRLPGLVLLLLVASGLALATTTASGQQQADRDPVARGERFSIGEDTRLLVRAPGVRANDRDPERQRLRVRIARGPEHGTARLRPNGRLRYTPDRNWSGTDSLVYVARDPAGNRDRARVVFEVAPVNDGPSISMKAQSPVREGSTSRVTITASDPENDPLRYFFDCRGDGTFEVGPVTENVHECAYDDESNPTVVGRVRDSHGARIEVALQIRILNRRPVVTPGPDRQAQAREPVVVDLGSFTDPGDDGPWQVTVDWGDGSSDQFSRATAGSLGNRSHAYAGGPDPLEVYDVDITVTEAGGGASGSGQLSVDVTS